MYTYKLTAGHVINSVAIPPVVLTTLIPKPGTGRNLILTIYFPQVRHCMLPCTSQPSNGASFRAKTDLILDMSGLISVESANATNSVVGFRTRKG